MGHSCNYAVVVAQLHTKGQCHGIHPFVVQLRDEETWMPMPGIKIGEIGPKLGMKTVNNGYLGFEKVRIPRKNMLMKNVKVLKDGTYVKAPSSLLTYGTMMFVRVVILRDVSNYLSKAVTIATRYSAVRRQSPIDPNSPEPQVIDHITQQYKLFPQLAKVFVIKLAADYIWDLYNQVTSELDRGDLERLPEVGFYQNNLTRRHIVIEMDICIIQSIELTFDLFAFTDFLLCGITVTLIGVLFKSRMHSRQCQCNRSVAFIVRRSWLYGEFKFTINLWHGDGGVYIRRRKYCFITANGTVKCLIINLSSITSYHVFVFVLAI